jgi:sterol desaturase/sphingolipid hydroxylase (fatty acid hydroxylase superfamily)
VDIEKIFPLVLIGMFVAFAVLEALLPARPLARVKGWRLFGVVAFFVTGATSALSPLLYIDFARAHRLGDLEWLGTLGGAAVAFVALELVGYWVHRASHWTPLWRAYHQVHHSAERVDIYGSAFFHPLEIVVGGVMGAVVGTMVLGVSAQASALAGLVAISISMLQHTNVKTPRWLGYIVQRPESHSVHHRTGFHGNNYSRIPLIDLLFGTFENPEYFEPDTGFYPGASRRVLAMLVGMDVSEPRRPLEKFSARASAQATAEKLATSD